MNIENYYEILGVEETATQNDIKKIYRKLAKENHPDAGGDEEKFKKIAEAYDILGDENKRKEYDVRRKNPFGGLGGGGMDDIFQQMFNQAFGGRSQQRKVHDTVIDVEITPEDSYMGVKKEINYRRKKMCSPCNGSGGDKKVCPNCGGQGFSVRQVGSGMFVQMVQVACNVCAGGGNVLVNPCYSCSGTGSRDEMKTIEVKLPHAIDDGQFVRLQGIGDFRNGVYGNLLVRIKMKSSSNFEKVGPHLVYNAYFNLEDIKKDSFEIPHPDGAIKLKFPKLFDSSKPLRVKSKGYSSDIKGDLLINQHIKFER